MSDLIERAREASTLKYQYHTIHVPTILIRMADEADKAAAGLERLGAELSALQALHAAGAAPYDAEIDRLQKRCAGLEEENAALRADDACRSKRVAAMIRWLEDNQHDVFSRGIWEAIKSADAALDSARAKD